MWTTATGHAVGPPTVTFLSQQPNGAPLGSPTGAPCASMQHVPMVGGVPSLLPLRPKELAPRPQPEYDLPEGYRTYAYGQREVRFASQLAVPEPNYGVVINAEFPLRQEDMGREVCIADYEIRNQNWQHIGPMLPRAETIDHLRPDAQSGGARDMKAKAQAARDARGNPLEHRQGDHAKYLEAVADWSHATDCHLGHSKEAIRERYDRLHGMYKPAGYQEHDFFDQGCFERGNDGHIHLKRPIVDNDDMREFWSNPAAVTTGGGYM